MKPFEADGQKGVTLEGSAEISTVAAGLSVIVDIMKDDPDNKAVRLASTMQGFLTDIVSVEATIATDPETRLAIPNYNTTEGSRVNFDISDPYQLQLTEYALGAAATQHPDPLVNSTALAMASEFAAIKAANQQ